MQTNTRRWALRQHTATAHAAVDAAIGAFDDIPSYKAYLAAVASFRRPLEHQLSLAAWPAELADWRPKLVSDAIAADLADLGLADSPATPAAPLPLAGSRLFGTLYVLEGSALGAQLLFRRAQALGFSADFGARHLALLGGSVDSWRGFLDRLERANPFDLDGALDGSLAAFALARAAFQAT
jgi:heme oxygenase (biliverdin-IX-beta and delta-forming)